MWVYIVGNKQTVNTSSGPPWLVGILWQKYTRPCLYQIPAWQQ